MKSLQEVHSLEYRVHRVADTTMLRLRSEISINAKCVSANSGTVNKSIIKRRVKPTEPAPIIAILSTSLSFSIQLEILAYHNIALRNFTILFDEVMEFFSNSGGIQNDRPFGSFNEGEGDSLPSCIQILGCSCLISY